MNRSWQKWTDEEVKLLNYHWRYSTMEVLLQQFPNRNYIGLMNKAKQLRIKSETERSRKGSLDFLDNLTKTSTYWWGFIIADGHLGKNGALMITLNKRDQNNLQILANHLNCKLHDNLENSPDFVTLCIQDKKFGEKWLKILNIHSPKTYTPPDLSVFLTKEYLLPFFIGLVDGDGCIWKSKGWLNLRVELHLNWFNTLSLISEKLNEFYNIKSVVRITKKQTAKIDINTKADLIFLKNNIKNIDFMERKWIKLKNLELTDYSVEARQLRAKSKIKTKEEFIKRATKKYGDNFIYDLTNFKGMTANKIKITCLKHGEFEQIPHTFLLKSCKTGCVQCGIESFKKIKTKDYSDFLENAIKIHNKKYDYPESNRLIYINRKSKIEITCPLHGNFIKSGQKHLLGQGCSICKRYKI